MPKNIDLFLTVLLLTDKRQCRRISKPLPPELDAHSDIVKVSFFPTQVNFSVTLCSAQKYAVFFRGIFSSGFGFGGIFLSQPRRKQVCYSGMDELTKLSTLIDLAEQLGFIVRRAPAGDGGEHPGGALVRLGKKEMLFLDPTASTADQINVVAAALKDRPQLQDKFLPPEIREAIES